MHGKVVTSPGTSYVLSKHLLDVRTNELVPAQFKASPSFISEVLGIPPVPEFPPLSYGDKMCPSWPSLPATRCLPTPCLHPSYCADFNNDDYICMWDLEQTVTKLTRGELSAEEVSLVCEKVLDEADGDHDGRLSLEDFQNMILRAPDFLR